MNIRMSQALYELVQDTAAACHLDAAGVIRRCIRSAIKGKVVVPKTNRFSDYKKSGVVVLNIKNFPDYKITDDLRAHIAARCLETLETVKNLKQFVPDKVEGVDYIIENMEEI